MEIKALREGRFSVMLAVSTVACDQRRTYRAACIRRRMGFGSTCRTPASHIDRTIVATKHPAAEASHNGYEMG